MPKKKEKVDLSKLIEDTFDLKYEEAGSSILDRYPSLPTGSYLLDEVMGDCKGYPENSFIEAYGPQASGKSVMGYLAIAASQRKHPDRENVIINAEGAFQKQAIFAHRLGVDVTKVKIINTNVAEKVFDIIEMLLKHGNIGVIMVDSVTTLCPLEHVNKSMQDGARIAALAAVMSKGLQKTNSAKIESGSTAIVYFINQTRIDPGIMYGAKEKSTGGLSLKFYCDISMRIAKIKDSVERDNGDNAIGHQVKVRFDKNRVGSLPTNPVVIKLMYGINKAGIDNEWELRQVAQMHGILRVVKKHKAKVDYEWNFVKPNNDEDAEIELLDNTIENFTESQINEVLDSHPKIKDMVLQYIEKGEFFSSYEIEEEPEPEDNDNVEDTEQPKRRKLGKKGKSDV